MKNLIVALIGKMKSIIASIRKNAEEALSWLNAIEKDKYQHYALGFFVEERSPLRPPFIPSFNILLLLMAMLF